MCCGCRFGSGGGWWGGVFFLIFWESIVVGWLGWFGGVGVYRYRVVSLVFCLVVLEWVVVISVVVILVWLGFLLCGFWWGYVWGCFVVVVVLDVLCWVVGD